MDITTVLLMNAWWPKMNEKAVCLVSGGPDSAVSMFVAMKVYGYDVHALNVSYGQRHSIELEVAKKLTSKVGVNYKKISVPISKLVNSALTDLSIEVDKGDLNRTKAPNTYVGCRNAILLSLAAAYAEKVEADHIFTGINAVDCSRYPDCTARFISSMEVALNEAAVRWSEPKGPRLQIHTPLLSMTKGQTIKWGKELGVPFNLTWSCYNPQKRFTACGECDSCLIRLRGFDEAGIEDPIPYVRRV